MDQSALPLVDDRMELIKNSMMMHDHLHDAVPYGQSAYIAHRDRLKITPAQVYQSMANSDPRTPSRPTPNERDTALNIKLRGVLFARLEVWADNWLPPRDYLMCFYRDGDDYVNVFYVFGNETGVISADKHLFPSDELITQLRLLRG